MCRLLVTLCRKLSLAPSPYFHSHFCLGGKFPSQAEVRREIGTGYEARETIRCLCNHEIPAGHRKYANLLGPVMTGGAASHTSTGLSVTENSSNCILQT